MFETQEVTSVEYLGNLSYSWYESIYMSKQIAQKKQVSVPFSPDGNVKTIFADERAVKQILVRMFI